MIFVVTDPYYQATVKTDAELASTITVGEQKKILALAIGETITLKRDFGCHPH